MQAFLRDYKNRVSNKARNKKIHPYFPFINTAYVNKSQKRIDFSLLPLLHSVNLLRLIREQLKNQKI
jgi:hypothetical protein